MLRPKPSITISARLWATPPSGAMRLHGSIAATSVKPSRRAPEPALFQCDDEAVTKNLRNPSSRVAAVYSEDQVTTPYRMPTFPLPSPSTQRGCEQHRRFIAATKVRGPAAILGLCCVSQHILRPHQDVKWLNKDHVFSSQSLSSPTFRLGKNETSRKRGKLFFLINR